MAQNRAGGLVVNVQWDEMIVLINDGLLPIVERQWNESGMPGAKLHVDWPRYQMLETEGVMKWVSFRDEGKLVGYATIFLTHPLHHKDDMTGMVDSIYLMPEARKGSAGLSAISRIEEMLEDVGVNIALFYVRDFVSEDRGGVGKILERKGFNRLESGWMKRLGA